MTRPIHYEVGTDFGAWLRVQPELDSRQVGLSIQNLDYIVHRYKFKNCQAVMLIEEKTRGGKVSFAQRDTHGVIDQALRYANNQFIKTARGDVMRLRYCGYHVLTFENTTPDNGAMWWNNREIDRATLIRLLRFEVDPQTI